MDVTNEMRQAVAEEQCRAVGHTYESVSEFGGSDPLAFLCSHCGRRWNVTPAPTPETGSGRDPGIAFSQR
jgi:hypothetical protein